MVDFHVNFCAYLNKLIVFYFLVDSAFLLIHMSSEFIKAASYVTEAAVSSISD